jgi:hypothetical protein
LIITRLLALAMIVMMAPSFAHATRYWVDPTGSDANACVAVDGDIDPGVYRATPSGGRACLSGGDTLTIKAGTYTGSTAVLTSIPAGPSSSAPTVIEGDPADQAGCALASTCGVILQPSAGAGRTAVEASNVVLRRLRINHINNKSRYPLEIVSSTTVISNILIEDVEMYNTTGTSPVGPDMVGGAQCTSLTSFVTFRRVHVHHNGNTQVTYGHGLYLQGDDIIVEHSSLHDNANTGMQFYTAHTTSDGRADRGILRYTRIYDNGRSGVALEGNDAQIYNNLIYNNGNSGMITGYAGGAPRAHIYNNVITGNAGTGLTMNGGTTDTQVKNNVISGNAGEEVVDTFGTAGIVVAYNACTSSESCGTTGKLTIANLASIFVSSSDYRLKSGSAAINAGTSVTGPGCNGVCDIGAYEAVADPTGSITTNVITLTFPMNTDVPILIPSAAGVTIACTGSNCPGGGLTASVATGEVGTDSRVEIVVSGFASDACVATNQAVTVTYTTTSGIWTGSTDRGGNGLRQQIFSFSNLPVTNLCTGSGPPGGVGTPLITYKFDEGTGTTATNTGSSGATDNGTLANGAGWTTGKTGSAVNITGGTQQVQVPYTPGNPTTNSQTWVLAVNVPAGSESATRFDIGTQIGTSQRLYVGAVSGTWRVATQSTNTTAAGASNLTVSSGWQQLCLNANAATDTVTLHKDGVAGTGGATRVVTSFTPTGDILIGLTGTGFPAAMTPGAYDDFHLYESVEDCAAIYADWNPPPVAVGTFGMPATRFQSVYLTELGGSPTTFGTAINQAKDVVAGGAVAVLMEWQCEPGTDCEQDAVRLEARQNGTGAWLQVPDTESDTHIYMWGSDSNALLNAGATTSRLSAGSCTVTNGVTLLTSAQVPVVDLPQDGCVVLRYIVRLGATASGYYDLRLSQQNGVAFTGTVNPARINVVPMQAGAP